MTAEIGHSLKDAADDDLRRLIEQAGAELKEREVRRKEAARARAQSILAKAQEEAKAVLLGAGLAFRQSGKAARPQRGVHYRAGHLYRHPDDAKRTWNGRGVRPSWIRELESQGRQAIEAPADGDRR